MTLKTLATLSLTALLVAGCGTTPHRAPVIDRLPAESARSPQNTAKPATKVAPREPDWRPATYTVKKGDTLYSLALEFGLDYRELAEWNGIGEPYLIRVGQVLRLTPPGGEGVQPLKAPAVAEAKPLPAAEAVLKTEPKAIREPYSEQALARLEKSAPPKPESASTANALGRSPPEKPAADKPLAAENQAPEEDDPDRVEWVWPATGKLLASFGEGGSKGVDIAGNLGQPVLAAAAGKVVHTGTTLRGYGKLIIIKHNKSYFSVYAHNSQILVKEGQNVVRGQKIAEMGDSDADRVKLHFEIRRLGKPVDPLKYLPNDKTS
ncbi:peptidoglycan DD-metalloendopeptidase family protein [Thiobacter aerophilum]|uniref:Peptidoglycan DD-metalloendopeptidase family protein n=1 Tax=Thiobacter aerophilum TaxID=3121275 RepID=A0ABV0EB27_9BURK